MDLNKHLVFLSVKCDDIQDYLEYDEAVGYGGMDQIGLKLDGQTGIVVEKSRVNEHQKIIRKFEEPYS